VLGETFVNLLVKRTFFAHFCAGEDEASIKPVIDILHASGVGSILDYAAEADDPEIQNISSNQEKQQASFQSQLIDDASSLDMCRKYYYEGEDSCDQHVETFLNCIESVHNVTPGGFAAIKLTALGPPALLKRMATAIVEVRRLFEKFDKGGDGLVNTDEFVRGYRKYFVDDLPTSMLSDEEDFSLEGLLHSLDPQNTGFVDYIEWSNRFRLEHLPALTARCRESGPLSQAVLSDWEIQAAHAMSERIDTLAARASELGVSLMIDAEQTYFQPAIDNIVYRLQEKYNAREGAVAGRPAHTTVYNTYQCYLKDSLERLTNDLDRARRLNYSFGAKIVRGAYMVSERQLAAEQGVPSPVHDTLEDTHASYDQAVVTLLDSIKGGAPTEFMVASHNQHSVEFTLSEMKKRGLGTDSGVHFGQLLGMSDHLTFKLGAAGYKAHKYVPYGEVGLVIPYLLRRAQENSALLGTARNEIAMLRKEITRRIMG